MKGILVSGLLAFSPFLGHAQGTIYNTTNANDNMNTQTNVSAQNLDQQLWNDLSSLLQQFSNSDNVDSIIQQLQQVIDDTSQLNQLSTHGFVHHPGLYRHFPRHNVIQQTSGNGMQGSGNWAGYVDTPSSNADPYTSVSGTWKVPSITGSQQGVAAQWIGLGGVSTQDLLQMGTVEEFDQGKEVANVFWEQLPQVAQNIMTVPIGSSIHASISENANSTWSLTFTANEPDGQSVSKTVPVTLDSAYAQAIGTSAEWISEDPSDSNGQLLPLANMGMIHYSQALVNGQPMNASGNQAQPLALVSANGNVLMAPSSIGSDGETFSTQPLSASNNIQRQGYSQRPDRRHISGRHNFQGWGISFQYGW